MKKKIYCDECNEEFAVMTKSEEPVKFCIFCGTELLDWNIDTESQEL